MKKLILMCLLICSCEQATESLPTDGVNDSKDSLVYGPVYSGMIGYFKENHPTQGSIYDTVAVSKLSFNVTGNKLVGSLQVVAKDYRWVDKLNYRSGYFEGHTWTQRDTVFSVFLGDTTWKVLEATFGAAAFDLGTSSKDSIFIYFKNANQVSGTFVIPDSLSFTASR